MSKKPLKIIAGSPDSPLRIGGIEIPCYVLEDTTRVLSQGGFVRAIGRTGGPRRTQGDLFTLPVFLQSKNLKPFIPREFANSSRPIKFQSSAGGVLGLGYRAEILPQVCEVFLKARDAGVLAMTQKHIAERADILIRGFARIGIIALVDEATGYDKIRSKNALIKILEKFIPKELHIWTKTFPYSFYEQICRLRGWPGYYAIKRPHLVAEYTNDFIYKRIAPGVLRQVQKINPINPKTGERMVKHHQWFTEDVGHPKLRAHIEAVTALMRASANMTKFKALLVRAYPQKYDNFLLSFMDDADLTPSNRSNSNVRVGPGIGRSGWSRGSIRSNRLSVNFERPKWNLPRVAA